MTIQYNLMEPVCQKAFNKFYASETPTELSLKISPSCHTLSKNLDISKKRHKIQQKGMHQRLNIILWTMDNSWFTQESLARKPDWSAESHLCSWRGVPIIINVSLKIDTCLWILLLMNTTSQLTDSLDFFNTFNICFIVIPHSTFIWRWVFNIEIEFAMCNLMVAVWM